METEKPSGQGGVSGLGALFAYGVQLAPDREQALKEGLDKGLAFFDQFNTHRLELAFGGFDEDMKKALFEVLFLLHVNDPKLAQWKFTAIRKDHSQGVLREKEVAETTDLYVEGAPHGVEGIDKLSPVFRKAFEEYLHQNFSGVPFGPQGSYGFNAIVSIHSLGSIGTIGHKSKASDLDLQVQYELDPWLVDTSHVNDITLREQLNKEVSWRMQRIRAQEGLPPEALQEARYRQSVMTKANGDVSRVFPLLWKYLVAGGGNYAQDLAQDTNQQLRGQLLQEMMTLLKRAQKPQGEALKKKENLFKERLGRIQNYLFAKFPHAEIYLFSSTNDNYRKGFHGTTLESKEASGSAYELILNYETLMPGIQITPMVPSHFILPKFINDDTARYDRMMDYIRFNLMPIYQAVRPRVTNLGATPDMTMEYLGSHGGAVYWEAFKASSGNLPKAILNLLRIEMMLDKRFLKTIIQLIKEPKLFNPFISPKPADATADIEAMVQGKTGLPTWAILEIEQIYPPLLQDPWWHRYKALKVGFAEPQGVPGLDIEERNRISAIIDQAFALHVRLSDVFTKPGDTRPFNTLREKVLLEFLRRAFPPVSARRTTLEHLFVGEVHAVNHFESELRDLFKRSLQRCNQKIAALNMQGEGNKREFEIWYHYYQQNFEPAPNVIQRTIMGHLKVARGRLVVGYKPGEGWFFNSQQKESTVGKRFDTFGTLDHLPDEVELLEKVSFLGGLTHCIINGYYGILNKGTLKERRTVLEFHPKYMDLGNRTDNALAFIRPDNVERILTKVQAFFPYQSYHYMDCIRQKRRITEVLIFVNLFKFGRLSLLYRDNLRTWYCDEFDHPDVFNQAQKYKSSLQGFMGAKPLHVTLAGFFKSKGVVLDNIALDCWFNPHSLETSHSATQSAQKETDLSQAFVSVVQRVHGPRPAAPAAETPTA